MNPANLFQARKRARLRALQALYQHELNPQGSRGLIEQFLASQDMQNTDIDYFSELVRQIISTHSRLDELLLPYLDIPPEKLDITERCILRIAAYEFSQRLEIPFRVIINESIGLAKKFGATDGHKYVNGVLDKAARTLRPHE